MSERVRVPQGGAAGAPDAALPPPLRIALFVFDWHDAAGLQKTLARIPESVDARVEELVLAPYEAEDPVATDPEALLPGRALPVRVHRLPRDAGWGAARKAALEYALLRGFDAVITMAGDGRHPPEHLPALLDALARNPDAVVLVARRVGEGERRDRWSHLIAHVLATGLQNRLLGLRLVDYHSSFRAYPAEFLRRVPFLLNDDGRPFDMQTLIQARALGAPVVEVHVPPSWREYPSSPKGLRSVLRYTASALDYRLHQLHVTKAGHYLVDHGAHYTLKTSRTGSHMQIVEAIPEGADVLDLGCSQGLLAGPLRAKGVRLTGVDVGPAEGVAAELERYFQRDLEEPLELPTGRAFDWVVCSDVIEHLRNRTELLRSVRRYLKPDGRLLISTPNVALWFYRLSLLAGRFEYGPRGVLDETHVHLYTRATFKRAVEKAGFRVVRERVTALPFEVVFESTGRSRLMRWVARGYHALARLWPEMFAYQILLEAEIITLDHESTAQGP